MEIVRIRGTKYHKHIDYLNIPVSFDIETSSFEINGEKRACMYAWALDFDGEIITGRTWEEFIDLIKSYVEKYNLNEQKRLVIYVHNLAYEFQWLGKYFEWIDIMSVKARKPVRACTRDGIEFRCSYLLTNKNLAKVGEDLEYPIKKLTGNLDYTKIRHSETPLTEEEWEYLKHDVQIVTQLIREKILHGEDIAHIPYTSTSYVRKLFKERCLKDRKSQYHYLMEHSTLTPESYLMLKRAYQGGFTHANAIYQGQILKDVHSYDFTSSYPYVLVSEKYPVGKPIEIILDSENIEKYAETYSLMFDVEFYGLKLKPTQYECPLSRSKCYDIYGERVNNGRIESAIKCSTTLTDPDWYTIKEFYDWTSVKFVKAYAFSKMYLPTEIVLTILELYEQKTKLKGVKEQYAEYMLSKERLNSIYGMMVTEILQTYNKWNVGIWEKEEKEIGEGVEQYNSSSGRFLFYPWGVWCSAYARRNLFTGINECGEDYIYSDTDSIKMFNIDGHREYFENYEKKLLSKLEKACKWHKIDFEKVRPKTIKGVEKLLGTWDYEGKYDRFKTLGAKRYMTEKNGEYEITVAGLGKNDGMEYILEQDVDPFEFFTEDMKVPGNRTGKQTLTYIDHETEGVVTDYLGNEGKYRELSSIHMEGCSYDMSISGEYKLFLDWLLHNGQCE